MTDITNIVVLVVLLVALAGVIAYTGDVLGTLVGKRRLSLFGVRPKQSGRIIGVFAGILIMLVTLGTLALSFRNAVQVIMRAQPVGVQLAEQEARVRRSTAQVEELQTQVEARSQELFQAQTEVETAERARDEARADISDLQVTQQGLETDIANLNTSLASAQDKVAEAEANLLSTRRQFEEADQARQEAVAEAAEASKQAAASRQDVETLTKDVAAAQAQLGSVQGELVSSREELAAAQQTLEDTQTRLAETQDALSSAQGELDRANSARDEAVQKRQEAEARAATLQENIDGLEEQAERLSSQNSSLSAQNSELEENSSVLLQRNVELARLNNILRADTVALNEELEGLQSTNATLMQDLERQTNELERAKEEAANVNSRNISYDVNQVVHSGVIAAQEPTLVRVQLAQLVQAASENAVLRGGLNVVLSPEQNESIVQEVSQTPGEDVVVLRSKMNQYVSAPVEVAVEVAPNQKLVDGSQLVVSRQIFLGPGSRDQLRDDLVKVLADANAKLLGLGLADEVYPSLSETSLEVEGFTNQLLRLEGPVTVGLQASAPIFAGGPAKLEFIIIN